MKYLFLTLSIMFAFACAHTANAAQLKDTFSGRILLQVQEKGKAWYIDPLTRTRAYLGKPSDAFRVMRELGLGISNANLEKISASEDSAVRNRSFALKFAGRILLQVEEHGEAWYVNPIDLKRYFLGRPSDAFTVMRGQGLGISNDNINKIAPSQKYADPEQPAMSESASVPSSPVKEQLQQQKPQFKEPPAFTNISGSYRCWSYNVSGGGGGDCRLFAPIVLNKDGTYSVSSEKGTYSVSGDILTLSESKLRGPGKLIGGTQIRFEYDYNNWHHVVTYLKEGGTTAVSSDGAVSEVPVQITLEYPEKDSALNSIVTMELVFEGQDVKKASYKPTAIAVWDGDRRVTASFHKATSTPQTGKKYDVYANWGTESTKMGQIDLTNAKTQVVTAIKVLKAGGTSVEQKEEAPSPAPEIVVEIDLIYPGRDSSLGSIQTVTLVPQGQDPTTAVYKPMALAIWDGDRAIVGSFHKATNQVKIKAVYDVYADWGAFGGYVKSGILDLTNTTAGPITKQIQTTISGTQ
ncbi:MAG: hypothetical protein AAB400_02070 [Patescibacteria group bacterium]